MQNIFDVNKNDKDYYSILNCVDSSSMEQIKAEYKRLALLHHPDKAQNTEGDSQYPMIKEAFDVIGDPQNRAKYDRWRQSGLCIPFEDYIQLSGHAQTIHWQALPTQLTLTEQGRSTDEQHVKSVRPHPRNDMPKITLNKNSFWSKKSSDDPYTKFRNYEI
ncbi:DnaJ domain-containing protein [Halteromyces radiatus]|uniref:DnaJ domain-containing protein n=1 Tax=Halteromyces radiatus TaxID=101107 RepID=UPI00221E91C3|nr:DnaJ domain-containing protein [Halteromyces radiatus]KAI8084617.1 DnaJ domain-containing protein [Halteromyces radiatus]